MKMTNKEAIEILDKINKTKASVFESLALYQATHALEAESYHAEAMKEQRASFVKALRQLPSEEVYTPAIRRMGVLWMHIEELIQKLEREG